jgi:hypothetical protein
LAGILVTLHNPAIATAFVILGYSALWLRMLGVTLSSLGGEGREYAALLSCWFVSMNVSPFVPFSTVVGEAIGEKTAVVALRYNSGMSLVMLVVAPLLMW